MKKLLGTVLSFIMLLSCTACGNTGGSSTGAAGSDKAAPAKNETAAAAPAEGAAGNSRTLVVYFSCTGHTKTLAEFAAKALQADLFEIKPAQPYTSTDLNYNDKSTRATVEQNDVSVRPQIQNKVENIGKYDTIVLAYPIWWGQAPRIMDTFMESYDFSGKTMAAICTSGGSEIGSSDKELAVLGSKSAQWKEGRQFAAGTSADNLSQWFRQIGLLK